jgi:hypothetical protein
VRAHDLAVSRQPDVGLEAGGAERESPAERAQGVLALVDASAPVGEGDRSEVWSLG